MTSSRIGIFGGTFDPPHLGHLLLAENAADQLDLNVVLFAPAADPPHKQGERIASAEHRLAMVEMAIADNPRFALSRVDVDRPGPHYTYDMIALLARQYPTDELYFLLGGDALRDFTQWNNPDVIIANAHLAVMQRPGAQIDLTSMEAELPGLTSRTTFVNAPEIGISATTIRERLRRSHSIRYQVPAAVERYITERGLYLG